MKGLVTRKMNKIYQLMIGKCNFNSVKKLRKELQDVFHDFQERNDDYHSQIIDENEQRASSSYFTSVKEQFLDLQKEIDLWINQENLEQAPLGDPTEIRP